MDEASTPLFLIEKRYGEVAERLKAHAWKACGRRKTTPGFKSQPLRFFYTRKHLNVLTFL